MFIPRIAGLTGPIVCVAWLLGGCSMPAPPLTRIPETAPRDTADTTLGRALADDLAAHVDASAFYPLPHGNEAFLARLALVRAAECSLDVQYPIFHNDETGRALLAELIRAADLDRNDGDLVWVTREHGQETRSKTERGVGPFRRVGLFFQRLLPIE